MILAPRPLPAATANPTASPDSGPRANLLTTCLTGLEAAVAAAALVGSAAPAPAPAPAPTPPAAPGAGLRLGRFVRENLGRSPSSLVTGARPTKLPSSVLDPSPTPPAPLGPDDKSALLPRDLRACLCFCCCCCCFLLAGTMLPCSSKVGAVAGPSAGDCDEEWKALGSSKKSVALAALAVGPPTADAPRLRLTNGATAPSDRQLLFSARGPTGEELEGNRVGDGFDDTAAAVATGTGATAAAAGAGAGADTTGVSTKEGLNTGAWAESSEGVGLLVVVVVVVAAAADAGVGTGGDSCFSRRVEAAVAAEVVADAPSAMEVTAGAAEVAVEVADRVGEARPVSAGDLALAFEAGFVFSDFR